MRRLLRLVAVLALLGASMATGALPATAGTAGQPCVGVIVDARSLGGNVATRCSKGASGRDSAQVLTDAGFRVRLSSTGSYAGFLCQIDALPDSSSDDDGCAADANNYRYWGFFVREPGASGWTYSSKGVRGYRPVNGAQIGFRFETSRAETPPPVYAQDAVCPPSRPPAASPAASRPAAAPGRSRAPAPAASPRRSTAPAPGTARTPAPAAAPSAGASRRPAASARPTASTAPPLAVASLPPLPGSRGTPALSGPGVLLPESGSPVPAGPNLGAGSTSAPGRSGSLGAFLLGGALVLGLAGVAGLRWRSRRG